MFIIWSEDVAFSKSLQMIKTNTTDIKKSSIIKAINLLKIEARVSWCISSRLWISSFILYISKELGKLYRYEIFYPQNVLVHTTYTLCLLLL